MERLAKRTDPLLQAVADLVSGAGLHPSMHPVADLHMPL